MRVIKSNADYPKRCTCEECHAELEYDEADELVGSLGMKYVKCPVCRGETVVNPNRCVKSVYPTTFDYYLSDSIDANDAQDAIDEIAAYLCSDRCEAGEFMFRQDNNQFVFGWKHEDGVDVYVTKDY